MSVCPGDDGAEVWLKSCYSDAARRDDPKRLHPSARQQLTARVVRFYFLGGGTRFVIGRVPQGISRTTAPLESCTGLSEDNRSWRNLAIPIGMRDLESHHLASRRCAGFDCRSPAPGALVNASTTRLPRNGLPMTSCERRPSKPSAVYRIRPSSVPSTVEQADELERLISKDGAEAPLGRHALCSPVLIGTRDSCHGIAE
jgi:hypothetical protein